MAQTHQPNPMAQVAGIRAAYGPMADPLIKEQTAFIDMSAPEYARLKQRIIDRWEEVRAILQAMPTPTQLAELLRATGGPTQPAELGLTSDDVVLALNNAHYLRQRFTVAKLNQLFLQVW